MSDTLNTDNYVEVERVIETDDGIGYDDDGKDLLTCLNICLAQNEEFQNDTKCSVIDQYQLIDY